MYSKYTIITKWFKPWPFDPPIWRSLDRLKGHFTIPKKVTNNCQVYGIWVGHIPSKTTSSQFLSVSMFFHLLASLFLTLRAQVAEPGGRRDLKTTADGDFLLEVKVTQKVQKPSFAPW